MVIKQLGKMVSVGIDDTVGHIRILLTQDQGSPWDRSTGQVFVGFDYLLLSWQRASPLVSIFSL